MMDPHYLEHNWGISSDDDFVFKSDLLDNCVIERILQNRFDDPLDSSESSEDELSCPIDWDRVFKGKTKTMLLEVCVDSLVSAKNAVFNGADELEVCSSLSEGGLTPSLDLVKAVIDMVNMHAESTTDHKKVKVNVMIRCRPGWDFCYSDGEVALMVQQVHEFKQLDVDRFVFGALTLTKQIDLEANLMILEAADPKPVTFHRAFDKCPDPITAIETIIDLGFNRLLTSGQKASAADDEAIRLMMAMINAYGENIDIMPGAGINVDNVKLFTVMGCKIIHGSCRGARLVSSEEESDDELEFVTDGEVVRQIKNIIISD